MQWIGDSSATSTGSRITFSVKRVSSRSHCICCAAAACDAACIFLTSRVYVGGRCCTNVGGVTVYCAEPRPAAG